MPPSPAYTGRWIMVRSLPEPRGATVALHLWRTIAHGALASFGGGAPRFSVGVSGAVIDPSGRILILRHAFRRRHPWGLVSGWVNAGEAPPDAMRRELREETSLVGEVGPVLVIRSDRRAPSLEVVYLVRVSGGTFRPSAETPEGQWWDVRDPPPIGLHPTHRPLVALAARAAGIN